MNECGTGDRDSGRGIAKREENSNTERQTGNTEMVYAALKVRQRGLDLRGKSEKLFKEVSRREGYFSIRYKQWERWAWRGEARISGLLASKHHTPFHKY